MPKITQLVNSRAEFWAPGQTYELPFPANATSVYISLFSPCQSKVFFLECPLATTNLNRLAELASMWPIFCMYVGQWKFPILSGYVAFLVIYTHAEVCDFNKTPLFLLPTHPPLLHLAVINCILLTSSLWFTSVMFSISQFMQQRH